MDFIYEDMKKEISFWYYVVWGLGIIAIGLLVFGIFRALI